MPKHTEAEGIDIDSLPELSPQERMFVELLMFDPSVDGNATEAYKRSFNTQATQASIHVLASRLKGTQRVKDWLSYLTAQAADRIDQSRERYAAELKGIIHRAEQAGNYGAAMSGVKLLGSVYGHLNSDAKNPRDRAQDLQDLVWMYNNVDKETALKIAKETGLTEMLTKELDTLH